MASGLHSSHHWAYYFLFFPALHSVPWKDIAPQRKTMPQVCSNFLLIVVTRMGLYGGFVCLTLKSTLRGCLQAVDASLSTGSPLVKSIMLGNGIARLHISSKSTCDQAAAPDKEGLHGIGDPPVDARDVMSTR